MRTYSEYEFRSRTRDGDSQREENAGTFFMGRIILAQALVFAVLAAAVFLVCRGARSDEAKQMYSALCAKDYTASAIFTRAKDVMGFLTKPHQTENNPTETQTQAQAAETDGAGGEDLIAPGENISFSPFYLSTPIVIPVDYQRITSRFGYRVNPVTGVYGFHSGIDLSAPQGSDIYAAFDAVVEKADCSAGRGNYLFLNSDGNITTVYCHCSELLVNEGDVVKAGQLIARVGATGQATGPHLHFEIRLNGRYFNPEWVLVG